MSMSKLRFLLVLVAILALGLAACTAEEATPVATEIATEETVEEETVEEEATTEETSATEAEAQAAEATEEAVETETEEAVETEAQVAEATEEAVETETEEAVEEMVEAGNVVVVAQGDALRLGFAAALSGEGVSAFGVDINRGVLLALEDRPAVVVDGVEFIVELDVQDSLCSPEGGQTVANRFASDGSIVAVLGPMCSSACTAAAPIFDSAGISSVSASCTAATLTTSGLASFNRTVPSDAAQGVIAAEFIFNELGFSNIAVIDDGSAYGEGLVNLLIARFEELGGTIVARDAVTVGDTDFRALLENIASNEPQLIYFGGFNAEAARLVEQRFDVALENVPFMGADGIFGPEIANLAGASAEGVYASAPVPVSSDALTAFRERYVETFGEEPPSAFNTNSYDAANLILNAVEAVGSLDDDGNLVVDRDALSAYIRSASLDGLTGALACDGTGECSTADVAFYQIVDGVYVLYGEEPVAEEVEATEEPVAEEVEATEEPVEEATAEEEVVEEEVMVEVVEATETYEGAFNFMYPAGWDVTEGTDIVRLTMADATVLVSGASNFSKVIDKVDFASDAELLANFLVRSGYGAGEVVESEVGVVTVEATLARRGQSGQATLVDLGDGQFGAVVALSPDGNVAGALAAIVPTFNIPVVEEVEEEAAAEEVVEEVMVEVVEATETYEGAFNFMYPTGWDVTEGTDIVRLTMADATVLVSGASNFSKVIDKVDFASDAELLANFLVRSGYGAGEVVESEVGVVTVEATLARRGQSGQATLVDLGDGQFGAVVALSPDGNVASALAAIVPTFNIPVVEEVEEEAAEEEVAEEVGTIVDIAIGNEDFSTLVAAVIAADLVEALSAEDANLTVFAPTNEAFAVALEALGLTAEELLGNTELLTSVLLYHVVEGTVLAETVVTLDGESVATLQGAEITIAVVDGGVVLNGTVNVVVTDIIASNGVIHVIDAVLLPPADE